MSKHQWKKVGLALAVGSGVAIAAPVVTAQDGAVLEEILVTAR
jgi:hypothetical protein